MHTSPSTIPPVTSSASTSPALRCSRHTLSLHERNDPTRPRIEAFVQQAFAMKHGASIRSFMPTLLALQGSGDRVCGVAGFRAASHDALFLERYLHRPIDVELSDRVGHSVERSAIVEVGNLASMSCRAAFHLVAALPRLLTERGHRWIVFTATSAVRGILEQFNAPTIELAVAKHASVAGLGDDWGRYYDNDPRVMAGYLPDGLALKLSREKH